jgi:hypothetical protein
MALPADVRARFENDPANLLDFMVNPANNAECIKLGLIDRESGHVSSSNSAVESGTNPSLDVISPTDTAVVS